MADQTVLVCAELCITLLFYTCPQDIITSLYLVCYSITAAQNLIREEDADSSYQETGWSNYLSNSLT